MFKDLKIGSLRVVKKLFKWQPRSYWIAKLAVRGYRLHEEWTNELRAVNEFYSDNMLIFARSPVSELPQSGGPK
jgi:hypothetical protein